MQFPSDYLGLVAAAATTLRAIGARTRERAASMPEHPDLWLAVRDFEGLAARLEDMDDWAWQRGFGNLAINGQDLGVLDELLSRADAPILITDTEHRDLSRLREFLVRYSRCEYAFVQQRPNER